ncbi:MAG: hypothetical protein NT012_00075 [Candidatus Nealsonbacteria bacterium]|nr:hypothetical protein [Candidatus Nealsonbacteria bacterium]
MMPKVNKNIIIGIVIAVILIFISIIIYAFWQKDKIAQVEVPAEVPVEVQTIEEILAPGEIGEIEKTEIPEGVQIPELPPVILNTEGTIIEIKTDRLIVQGSGSNFTDQKPRELTLIFTDETITFETGQKAQYQGMEGLKHLKIGEKVNISSPENIRGKTQFKVDYINKL